MKKKKRKKEPGGTHGDAIGSDASTNPQQRVAKLDFSADVQAKLMVEARKNDEMLARRDAKHAALVKAETEEVRMERLRVQIKNQWLADNRDLILKWMQQERMRQSNQVDAEVEDFQAQTAGCTSEEELSDCSKISDASLDEGFHFKDIELESRIQGSSKPGQQGFPRSALNVPTNQKSKNKKRGAKPLGATATTAADVSTATVKKKTKPKKRRRAGKTTSS